MIKALIFDMDGTLVDSEQVHFRAWDHVLGRYGAGNIPLSEYASYVGASNEKLASDYIESQQLGVTVDELVGEKQKRYLDMIEECQPLAGALEIVAEYSSSYRLAVASSSECIELEAILSALQLRDFFEHVVGGDMARKKKPDPGVYLKALELLHLSPPECIAFEDSESGLTAAKAAGLFVVAIPNKYSFDHNFSQADLVVDSLGQITHSHIMQFS